MSEPHKVIAPEDALTYYREVQSLQARVESLQKQVRNGTGYSRGTARTADAVAMSLWPSRGLELLGFEVKSARHDWMREKADPAKMEEIGKFCDRWWLACRRLRQLGATHLELALVLRRDRATVRNLLAGRGYWEADMAAAEAA